MRRLVFSVFALVLATSLPQDAGAQISSGELEELVMILENGDGESLASKDGVIDYLPSFGTRLTPASEAIKLFDGCKAEPLNTADNRYGMTMLKFACEGRTSNPKCTTGDLHLMVDGSQIGVAEIERIDGEGGCFGTIPPPAPSGNSQ